MEGQCSAKLEYEEFERALRQGIEAPGARLPYATVLHAHHELLSAMTTKQIEVYVRHSGDRALMHFHVPDGFRKKFLDAINSGSLESSAFSVNLELSVLAEWVTDEEQRKVLSELGPVHLRIPIAGISL